jgi:hypothetical protein
MSSISDLAATLRQMAAPGIKPKELNTAVREKHPDATKKEIVRAAFFALSDGHDASSARSEELHAFALMERGMDEQPTVKLPKLKKKKDRKHSKLSNGTA